ncbi:MAG: response regulator, partial [Bosea sp.]|uniref:hypothetical protein n=1 Tax=Bosea sp. (in: a-proteobacteria) TaxID=1871050 RepID=UPI0023901F1E|nr:response regulator [Bosea sp. (in: a-proteobacteria)]
VDVQSLVQIGEGFGHAADRLMLRPLLSSDLKGRLQSLFDTISRARAVESRAASPAGGIELAERLRRQRDVKAIFMSGHAENVTSRRGLEQGDAHFIKKQFSSTSLARTRSSQRLGVAVVAAGFDAAGDAAGDAGARGGAATGVGAGVAFTEGCGVGASAMSSWCRGRRRAKRAKAASSRGNNSGSWSRR